MFNSRYDNAVKKTTGKSLNNVGNSHEQKIIEDKHTHHPSSEESSEKAPG